MKKNILVLKKIARFIQLYYHYCLWAWGIRPTGVHDQSRMIDLHCLTQGRGTDWLYKLTGWSRQSAEKSHFPTSCQNTDPSREKRAISDLHAKGYYIFPSRLDSHSLKEILDFAKKTPGQPRPARSSAEKIVFDPESPKDSAIHFERNDLVQIPAIQKLLSDPTILGIAGGYLRALPIVTNVGMWWSTPYQAGKNQDELAQRFHFDLDMLKWIKLFVYIVDVTKDNGAHSFVEGSHLPGGIPKPLLAKGYQRLSDEEVEKECGFGKIKIMEGGAGTMFFENTVGLHKGKVPIRGNRLVLEVEIAGSEFGSPPKKPLILRSSKCVGAFRRLVEKNPAFRLFDIVE